MSKTFGEMVRESLDALQEQKQQDREMFFRVFEALNRYDGRARDSHEVKQLSPRTGQLNINGERVCDFTVKEGKVIIGQDTLSEADALAHLAMKLAKVVTTLDEQAAEKRKRTAA